MTPQVVSRPYIFFALYLLIFCSLVTGCAELKMDRGSATHEPSLGTYTAKENIFVPDGFYETIPPLPEKGYFLDKIGKGVYFFSNGIYNNIFVVTSAGVVITDPIKGWGPRLKKAIKEVTDLPVKFMIYTHAHLDHIGDAHMFAEDVQIVAHNEADRMLRRYKDRNRPVPHITFGKQYTLTFGGTEIRLAYPGGGHGKGNIMVYLPQSGVLMFVDVAIPKSVPFKNFATNDIFGQVAGIQKALKLNFKVYVAGHYHRPGKRQDMEEVLKYYHASRTANIEAIKRVSFKDVVMGSQSKDVQRRMGEYYDAISEECYRILSRNWKNRLMGFEAFARGHCDVWTSYHKTEKTP